MTETLAQNLKDIELPRSIRNVLRFLADLGIALEPRASAPVGQIGSQSGELAASVFERHLGVTEMLPGLMARHEIQVLDIRRFALWIRRILPEEDVETPASYHRRSDPPFAFDPEVEARPLRTSRASSAQAEQAEAEERRVSAPAQRSAPARRSTTEPPSASETIAMAALAIEVSRPMWPAALGLRSFAFGMDTAPRWDPTASRVSLPEFQTLTPSLTTSEFELPSRPLFRGPEVTIEGRRIVDLPAFRDDGDRRAVPEALTVEGKAFSRPEEVGSTGVSSSLRSERRSMSPQAERRLPPLPANPLLAQLTLVAPPIRTSGMGVTAKSGTVAFDLPLLRKGAEPLTPARLQALRGILPPGVQALYPAIPTDALGPSAVNLPLAAESVSRLMRQGYGRNEPKWAESLAAHSFSTPPLTVLEGRILDRPQAATENAKPDLPLEKPPAAPASLLPTDQPEADPDKAERPSFGLDEPLVRPPGLLDFLGLPVQLAESPEKPHDLPRRHAARMDLRSVPTPLVRPTLFQEAQRKVLPHFHTIAAAPFASVAKEKVADPSVTASRPAAKATVPPLPIQKEAPRPVATPVFQPETLRPERSIAPQAASPATARPVQSPKPLVPAKPTAPEPSGKESHPRVPAPMAVAPPFPAPAVARSAAKGPLGTPAVKIPAVAASPSASAAPTRNVVNAVVKVEPAPVHVLPTAPAFKPVAAATTTNASTTARPAMPLVEKKPEPREDPALAVQASKGEPVAAAGGRASAQTSTSAAGAKGSKDAEIGLLANEVWSLLKRRLAFEAQRAGQR
jgi:hypothetical protein